MAFFALRGCERIASYLMNQSENITETESQGGNEIAPSRAELSTIHHQREMKEPKILIVQHNVYMFCGFIKTENAHMSVIMVEQSTGVYFIFGICQANKSMQYSLEHRNKLSKYQIFQIEVRTC
jgi:hypothetical protein